MLALSALAVALIVVVILLVVAVAIGYVLRKRRSGHVLIAKPKPAGGRARKASR